ncbi:MAG: NYN domain-containing protein [Deltaproteobacteria bacterium]|nr:NYN domain-containing protein [Deltaproteobacteria bacterium]
MQKPPLLPKKPNAPAFKKLYEKLKTELEASHWILILEGALDRRTLDATLAKYVPDAPRTENMERSELVGRVVGAMLHSRDVAFSVFRNLDRSSNKERTIVVAIDEKDLESHVTQYKALDFRRERARQAWAFLRDGREQSFSMALQILQDAFHRDDVFRLLDAHEKDESLDPDHNHIHVAKEELLRMEAVLSENQKSLHQEQVDRSDVEKERSQLIVRLGQRERSLKSLETEHAEQKKKVQLLEHEKEVLSQRLSTADEENLKNIVEERDTLRSRVLTLERKLDYADGLLPLQDENAELRETIATLEARLQKTHDDQTSMLGQITARERAAQERVSSLKGALKVARQLAVATGADAESGQAVLERVGLFVDVANIGASAKRTHGKNFDFIGMREMLLDERKQVIAVAFVVEAEGQKSMSGFSKMLMEAGYDVRIKRPKTRTDGTRKADWDMGIAMEVIEARNRLDTVILATGDGDFLPLIVKVKKWGKRVEVASFIDCTDRALLSVTDSYEDLTNQFLLDRNSK